MTYTPKNNFNVQLKRTGIGDVPYNEDLLADVACCDETDYDFSFGFNPDLLGVAGSVTIKIRDGCSDFIWSTDDAEYTFASSPTSTRSNVLTASGAANFDLPVLMTITDNCGTVITSYVNNFAPEVLPVVISPSGCTPVCSTDTVILTCPTGGSTIYYTTDGTVPTESSNEYSSPFVIGSTERLRARAYKSGYKRSDISESFYSTLNISWTLVRERPSGWYPQHVEALSSNVHVLDEGQYPGTDHKIFRSVDINNTVWTEVALYYNGYIKFFMSDYNNHCLACWMHDTPNNYIYFKGSLDGGITWIDKGSITYTSIYESTIAKGGELFNSSNAFVYTGRKVFTTVNFGSSWSLQYNRDNSNFPSFTCSCKGTLGVSVVGSQRSGSPADIIRTTDYGNTWTQVKTFTPVEDYYEVAAILNVSDTMVALVYNSTLSRTEVWNSSDQGLTWSCVGYIDYGSGLRIRIACTSNKGIIVANHTSGDSYTKAVLSSTKGLSWCKAIEEFYMENATSRLSNDIIAIPSDNSGVYIGEIST